MFMSVSNGFNPFSNSRVTASWRRSWNAWTPTLVGKHRNIEFTELIRLENQIKAERKKFLEDMAKEDYELGKLEGFDPVKNARR